MVGTALDGAGVVNLLAEYVAPHIGEERGVAAMLTGVTVHDRRAVQHCSQGSAFEKRAALGQITSEISS